MGKPVVVGACRIAGLAGVLLVGLWGATGKAAPSVDKPESYAETPFGAYLAGRHAQHKRDYQGGASWFEDALAADPASPELITRTFLMEVSVGRSDRARSLADSVLKLDPTDAVAQMVLLIDCVQKDDKPAALMRAEALPRDGVHRFVGPLGRAWTRMAVGDVAAADKALQEFDKFNGFAPLKYYQLGLIYDFAGQPDLAEENFKKTLEASGQLNWRLTDAMANFYERHGRSAEAHELYQCFIKENAGSEIAESVLASKPPGSPAPLIRSAEDGLAEGTFDLAGVVNQPETIDLPSSMPVCRRVRYSARNRRNRPRHSAVPGCRPG